MNSRTYTSDFLIIGSGIAGLTFAIKVSRFGSVNIVTKKKNNDSNTNYAQGGIATVLDPSDSIEKHIADTLTAGVGHCNAASVRSIAESGPARIHELIGWGVHFSTSDDSPTPEHLSLGREGGHSNNRIIHAADSTGREVERALLEKIAQIRNITIFENHTAIDLLTEHHLGGGYDPVKGPACYGAYVLENLTRDVHIFRSPVTMIASGGAGRVYKNTTNPSIATGDGIAMAYRAGAQIADMEFMQFHPTSLYTTKDSGRALLISEAVRGEGAKLINRAGVHFMENLHPLKELAPRDIVARAIDAELKNSGENCVFLDISFKSADFLTKRFPFIYASCLENGIDMTREPIPVVPAAHYLCGGVITDLKGRSSIKNLYIAGESACTGVHGANRLASNSLLEALVFAHEAAEDASSRITRGASLPEFPDWNKEGTFDEEEWILINHNADEIKSLMWDYVGIVRTNLRLERALRRIRFLEEEITDYYRRRTLSDKLIELRNLVTVAKLIITGAAARKESRGLHYNSDYPDMASTGEPALIQQNMRPLVTGEISAADFSGLYR